MAVVFQVVVGFGEGHAVAEHLARELARAELVIDRFTAVREGFEGMAWLDATPRGLGYAVVGDEPRLETPGPWLERLREVYRRVLAAPGMTVAGCGYEIWDDGQTLDDARTIRGVTAPNMFWLGPGVVVPREWANELPQPGRLVPLDDGRVWDPRLEFHLG